MKMASSANAIHFEKWTSEDVATWMKGLDDCVLEYLSRVIENGIDGKRLMMLATSDLEAIGIDTLGHQELILEAVDLLRNLSADVFIIPSLAEVYMYHENSHEFAKRYGYETENLQSLALQLGCKARSLHNEVQARRKYTENDPNKANLKSDSREKKSERLSTSLMSGVADLMITLKNVISWLDRSPFQGIYDLCLLRNTIVKIGLDLVNASQKEANTNDIEVAVMKCCGKLSDHCCEELVIGYNDPLVVQPATIELATIRKKPGEELGLHIQSSYYGIHMIGGITPMSPADLCGKIEQGDEVIQVNYQTVVGWQLKKLVATLKDNPKEVVLLLKKRPRHITPYGHLQNRKKPPSKQQMVSTLPKSIKKRRSRDGDAKQPRPSLHEYVVTPVTPDEDLSPKDSNEGNDTDNDVFRSGSESPQYMLPPMPDAKQRRATVSGGSPTLGRPSLIVEDLDTPTRPKSFTVTQCDEIPNIGDLNLANCQAYKKPPDLTDKLKTKESEDLTDDKSESTDSSKTLTVASDEKDQKSTDELSPGKDDNPDLKQSTAEVSSKDDVVPENSEITPKTSVSVPPIIEIQIPSVVQPAAQRPRKVTVSEVATDFGGKNQPQLVKIRKIDPLQMSDQSLEASNREKRVGFEDGEDKGNEELGSQTYIVAGGVAQVRRTTSVDSEKDVVLRKNKLPKRVDRRVSCKDLGRGDCEGWLFRRKNRDGLLLSGRWNKRWCILKNNNFYIYKYKSDLKAESVIHLPAFQVSPAPEVKTNKFAFKIHNSGTCFVFASERQNDMSKWMNKMGLAAISFDASAITTTAAFMKPEPKHPGLGFPNIYYSESEDDREDDDSSPDKLSYSSQQSLSSISSADTSGSSLGSPDVFTVKKPIQKSISSLSSADTSGSSVGAESCCAKDTACQEENMSDSRDDLSVLYKNLQRENLAIDGTDREKQRRSVITSADLLQIAPSPQFNAMRKMQVLQRTLKSKEQELNEIQRLLQKGERLNHGQVQIFKQSHPQLISEKDNTSRKKEKRKYQVNK